MNSKFCREAKAVDQRFPSRTSLQMLASSNVVGCGMRRYHTAPIMDSNETPQQTVSFQHPPEAAERHREVCPLKVKIGALDHVQQAQERDYGVRDLGAFPIWLCKLQQIFKNGPRRFHQGN